MKTWKIPVRWTMVGTVGVKANTLKEAVEIVKNKEGDVPISDNAFFLGGFCEIDSTDMDYVRMYYNKNQEDSTGNGLFEDLLMEQKEQM